MTSNFNHQQAIFIKNTFVVKITQKVGNMKNIPQKIKIMREINQWSQEEMANKLHMSVNGYAKIERGETKLTLAKLEQIAQIFELDVLELMQNSNKNIYFLMNNESSDNNTAYCGTNDSIATDNEKLKMLLRHKDELLQNKDVLLEQKQNEIDSLKEIITLLKKNSKSDS
ncbi:helix-turn-helix domain-containing protein [Moraxella haemolytica]|nr:helix-turn-helix transcriptional regulator [Moraxella sp. ZY171148]WII95685.1 helix-turn-helix domain-containing protein [Moraxella sp. ZY171148]